MLGLIGPLQTLVGTGTESFVSCVLSQCLAWTREVTVPFPDFCPGFVQVAVEID